MNFPSNYILDEYGLRIGVNNMFINKDNCWNNFNNYWRVNKGFS